jgi:hypothetical protein
MRSKFSIFTTLLLSLLLNTALYAAPQVLTSVSDNTVVIGDTFILSIEIDDSDSDYQLDTRPLENDFTVFRPSKSQRTEYINGSLTRQTNWTIRLQAKHTGEITIPALKIGPVSSEQIKLTVSPLSETTSTSRDDLIFMENSIDKNNLYIGQPLILTTKIFISQATDNLQLLAPSLTDATIEVYAKDQDGQTIRNGIRYKTITRQFQITPKQAGKFTISSPLLSGDIRKVVAVSDWQNKVLAQPINIRGESLTLEVKAKPEDFIGEWLVSDDVHLIENVNLTEQIFHVGDPITRSVSLLVAAMNKDKLPTVDFNYPKSLRFYPDQDELSEGQVDGKLYAQRNMRHAIIADQAGQLILPEIIIPWWNSTTDKQQFATLPEQTITILAVELDNENIDTSLIELDVRQQEEVVVSNNSLIYWQIFSVLLLFILVFFIFYHLSYRRQQMNKVIKEIKQPPVANQAYSELNSALQKNDAPLVYKKLLAYLQGDYHNLKSLSQLGDYINLSDQDKKQLLDEIISLGKACCDKKQIWNAEQLQELIEKHLYFPQTKNIINVMELNPSH